MKHRTRRERIAAHPADLKMPGGLEALDEILSGVDGGALAAGEAIGRIPAAQTALRNGRRPATAMRTSRLPGVKMPAECDPSFQPSLQRE